MGRVCDFLRSDTNKIILILIIINIIFASVIVFLLIDKNQDIIITDVVLERDRSGERVDYTVIMTVSNLNDKEISDLRWKVILHGRGDPIDDLNSKTLGNPEDFNIGSHSTKVISHKFDLASDSYLGDNWLTINIYEPKKDGNDVLSSFRIEDINGYAI